MQFRSWSPILRGREGAINKAARILYVPGDWWRGGSLRRFGGNLNDKTVIILCVSREILEGAVVDRNAAFMATRINGLGLRVRTIQVVDRVESEMVNALKWAIEQAAAFVVMTGGMGPNFDDNSRACAAKAAGLVLVESPEALEFIRSSYRRLHARDAVEDPEINEERARMAMVPSGAICFENPIGSAPGVELKVGGTRIFLLPGVPSEMQRMFTHNVLPAMMAEGPSTVRKQRTIDFGGGDESAISRVLATVAKRHPKVAVRTRVLGSDSAPVIQISLMAEQHDPVAIDELLEKAELDLRSRLGLETGHGD
jgi:molybdopterin-biosynthesis enzyme MoeA-like protein